MLTAKDMMTTDVVCLKPDQRTYEAVQLLLKRRVSGAPVVDEHGHLVGFFSEKDSISALMRAIHERLPSSLVRDNMTVDVISVHEGTGLLTIAHLFLTNTVRKLPVVRGQQIVGLISRRDLLRTASKVMSTAKSREAALLYLSAVNKPEDVHIHGR